MGEIGGRVWRKERRGQQSLGGQRGQSNFELAAHKVLSAQALSPAAVLYPRGGGVGSGREVMAGTAVDEGDEQVPAAVF